MSNVTTFSNRAITQFNFQFLFYSLWMFWIPVFRSSKYSSKSTTVWTVRHSFSRCSWSWEFHHPATTAGYHSWTNFWKISSLAAFYCFGFKLIECCRQQGCWGKQTLNNGFGNWHVRNFSNLIITVTLALILNLFVHRYCARVQFGISSV